MKKSIALIFIIFYVALCAAQQKSSIDFIIRNVGINVDGNFSSFSVTPTFDDSNTLVSITGEVEVKSIKTGIDSRDEHLLKVDYFHVSKHPLITLKSIALKKRFTNEYSATVNLKIKDKIKEITIPLVIETSESTRKITSEFEINRRDFGVGGRSLVMSNTVKIRVVYIETLDGY